MIATFWEQCHQRCKEAFVKRNYLRVTFRIRKLLEPVTAYLLFFICWIFTSHLFLIALFDLKIIYNNQDPSSSLKYCSIPKCGKGESPHSLGNSFQSSISVTVQWLVGLVVKLHEYWIMNTFDHKVRILSPQWLKSN